MTQETSAGDPMHLARLDPWERAVRRTHVLCILGFILASVLVLGCKRGDPAPAEEPPAPEATAELAEAARAPQPETSLSDDRPPTDSPWPELLDFDAGGRDLMIASFRPPNDNGLAREGFLGARACAATDPVQELVSLRTPRPRDLGLARRTIACGRLVASKLPPSARRTHFIELDRAGSFRPVHLIPTQLTDLAPLEQAMRSSTPDASYGGPDFRKESLGETPILCRPIDPDTQSCASRRDPSDTVIAVVEGWIVTGSSTVVASFLEWSRRDALLAHLAQIDRLGQSLGPLELDFLKPNGNWMRGRRRWLPFTQDGEFEPIAEEVRRNARAMGTDLALTSGHLVIAPRCDPGEKDCPARDALSRSFTGYHDRWKASALATMNALFERYPDAASPCVREEESGRIVALEAARVIDRDGLLMLTYDTGAAERACAANLQKTEAEAADRLRAALSEAK